MDHLRWGSLPVTEPSSLHTCVFFVQLFTDRNTVMDAVAVGHDNHLLVINDRESQLITGVDAWKVALIKGVESWNYMKTNIQLIWFVLALTILFTVSYIRVLCFLFFMGYFRFKTKNLSGTACASQTSTDMWTIWGSSWMSCCSIICKKFPPKKVLCFMCLV